MEPLHIANAILQISCGVILWEGAPLRLFSASIGGNRTPWVSPSEDKSRTNLMTKGPL